MHIEALGNGLGGQSMYLLHLACTGVIPATVSITADTGAENDCLWSTGERTTGREYFERVVAPLAERGGIDARFVRAQKGDGSPLKPLPEYVSDYLDGKEKSLHVPMFGDRGGRMSQTCTDRWKLAAMRQELRRMGATSARTAIGIHANEWDRMKGLPLGEINGWMTYQTGVWNKKTRQFKATKWLTHYYPLVGLNLGRESIRERLDALGIPYLVSSECDFCPHKNWARWKATSPETIEQIAALEKRTIEQEGLYFTGLRIPLKEALARMESDALANPSLFGDAYFGCENDVCGI